MYTFLFIASKNFKNWWNETSLSRIHSNSFLLSNICVCMFANCSRNNGFHPVNMEQNLAWQIYNFLRLFVLINVSWAISLSSAIKEPDFNDVTYFRFKINCLAMQGATNVHGGVFKEVLGIKHLTVISAPRRVNSCWSFQPVSIKSTQQQEITTTTITAYSKPSRSQLMFPLNKLHAC